MTNFDNGTPKTSSNQPGALPAKPLKTPGGGLVAPLGQKRGSGSATPKQEAPLTDERLVAALAPLSQADQLRAISRLDLDSKDDTVREIVINTVKVSRILEGICKGVYSSASQYIDSRALAALIGPGNLARGAIAAKNSRDRQALLAQMPMEKQIALLLNDRNDSSMRVRLSEATNWLPLMDMIVAKAPAERMPDVWNRLPSPKAHLAFLSHPKIDVALRRAVARLAKDAIVDALNDPDFDPDRQRQLAHLCPPKLRQAALARIEQRAVAAGGGKKPADEETTFRNVAYKYYDLSLMANNNFAPMAARQKAYRAMWPQRPPFEKSDDKAALLEWVAATRSIATAPNRAKNFTARAMLEYAEAMTLLKNADEHMAQRREFLIFAAKNGDHTTQVRAAICLAGIDTDQESATMYLTRATKMPDCLPEYQRMASMALTALASKSGVSKTK